MSLTPAELQKFHNQGYVVRPGVYSIADMEPIRCTLSGIVDAEARALHAEGRLRDLCAGEGFERRLAAIKEVDEEAAREIYRRILGKGGGGFSGPEMLDCLRHPALLSCVESLVGPDIVGSSVYRIRPKVPGWAHGEVPWHQDSGYFAVHCDAFLIVTCWIPWWTPRWTTGVCGCCPAATARACCGTTPAGTAASWRSRWTSCTRRAPCRWR
ncbi:MAG: hypothetical protein AB1505_16505 [Candidatus Latescibacterota bacterium]